MRTVIDPAAFRTPLPVLREDVPVPEFGDDVVMPVWGMTALERTRFEQSMPVSYTHLTLPTIYSV